MLIVPPVSIGAARILSSTAVISKYLEYVPGTTYVQAIITNDDPLEYANSDTAVVTYLNRDYESLKPDNVGHQPDISSEWWLDIGASNRVAMFDYDENLPTTSESPFETVILPGQRIDTVSLFGVDASVLKLDVLDPSGTEVIYDGEEIKTSSRNTTRAYEYAFGRFETKTSFIFKNLPPASGARIRLTLTKVGGNPSIETMCVGMGVFIGMLQLGAENDIIDFSTVTRTARGKVKLNPGKTVPLNRMPVIIKSDVVSKLKKLRSDYSARPLVFVGIEDMESDYFDAFFFLGLFKRMPIVAEYQRDALVSIEAEGL